MSHPMLEEEFDDDTDLPLPTHTLPNRGTRGPIIQEIDSDASDEELDPRESAPASSSSARPSGSANAPPQPVPRQPDMRPGTSRQPGDPVQVTDTTPYKRWTAVYPIYIDCKRAFGKGQRRIARKDSVWWPTMRDIALACAKLGLQSLQESLKSHPQDWDNPGRVKVLFKKDGRLVNPSIRTKKQLLTLISRQIQRAKPDLAPSPEVATGPPATSSGKKVHRTKLPKPPQPEPPLSQRFSEYSPALDSGILVEAIKNAIAAEKGQAAGEQGKVEGSAAATGGAAKGKRKVVRVRM